MENIRYGNLNAIDEEVIKAAKKADAHNLIIGLENGYNTEIGQGGARLSGGQKQRITIARVFLKNPPILIFDEATSNLDNESEKYIQESIKKLAETRTAIIIAHRISTIKNAKRILVIENGEIKQSGTHEELIKESGLYSTYYNLI
jgi:ATP-binding cassette subfamily B protein